MQLPRSRWRVGLLLAAACCVLSLLPGTAYAQDLGHKIPGTLGVDAGVQGPAGIFVADRFAWYSAERVRDRNGDVLPLKGMDLDSFADALGVQGTLRIRHDLYLSASFGGPLGHISSNTEEPRASIDRFGIGDAFLMPVKVGFLQEHFDLVASYTMYIPTGKFEPKGGSGIGNGHWTHQFSLGGAVFSGPDRKFRASALASYDLNLRKRDIDITRGDTIQIQGGAGVTLMRIIDVGLAGYALWQVREDRGSDLPPVLRGASDRVYGLGPEVNVLIPKIRTRVGVRYEWDLSAWSRPQGRVLVVTVDFAAWQPRPAAK